MGKTCKNTVMFSEKAEIHEAIAECFIPDKTRITTSLLNGFKNEPFRKFK